MSLLFRPTVSQHVPNPGVARIFISQVQEGRDRRLCPSIFPLLSRAPPHHPLLACADVPAFDPDPHGRYHHLPSSPLVGQTQPYITLLLIKVIFHLPLLAAAYCQPFLLFFYRRCFFTLGFSCIIIPSVKIRTVGCYLMPRQLWQVKMEFVFFCISFLMNARQKVRNSGIAPPLPFLYIFLCVASQQLATALSGTS